jgi:hypothetical protein
MFLNGRAYFKTKQMKKDTFIKKIKIFTHEIVITLLISKIENKVIIYKTFICPHTNAT